MVKGAQHTELAVSATGENATGRAAATKLRRPARQPLLDPAPAQKEEHFEGVAAVLLARADVAMACSLLQPEMHVGEASQRLLQQGERAAFVARSLVRKLHVLLAGIKAQPQSTE
eukprot:CAMPEP_0198531190 /NCGR_PEP_ID=MMETSP1462-20131121/26797_1 /TAXON_ID=1333877 /ORGANISM="Brandtodinium nutriculum, Strain RCC3387" /LENGTH=114 /DNA_ID=CAMNT_0044261077 /DNA_START=143 /DNA_END=485 /DNA_ORIENTATION=+